MITLFLLHIPTNKDAANSIGYYENDNRLSLEFEESRPVDGAEAEEQTKEMEKDDEEKAKNGSSEAGDKKDEDDENDEDGKQSENGAKTPSWRPAQDAIPG